MVQAQPQPTDPVLWVATANHERPSARPVPGRLLVTDRHLRFQPRHSGGSWQTELQAIRDVMVTEWPPAMGTGPRRKRIRIETLDGRAEVFAVALVSHGVEVIRVAARAAGVIPSSRDG